MENDSNIFREVNEKSDIVKVIGYFLGNDAIVKSGKKFKSICPFHNDSHPSMQIDSEKKFFHCFSCGAGGDTIRFVEKYCHLSSIEALKKVCEICAIPLPSQAATFREKKDVLKEKYPKELSALEELGRFYSLFLQSNDGKKGRDYLSARKIERETIEHFEIGFAPEDPTLAIASLRRLGFEVPTLERAGILSGSAELRDRYSGRIMFPIKDSDGHIVGFSGRKVSESQEGGKYINYPETELFHKSQVLYHFDRAKESCRRDGYIYLLEGFMDVIAMQRAGLLSAAGLMGTALTEEHIHALKETKAEIRLLLDSDEAGQLGEERALPLLSQAGIPMRVCWKFDKAKDADELLTKFGKEELVRQVNRLYSPVMFLLGRALNGQKALLDNRAVEDFVNASRPYFFQESEIARARDIRAIAKRTGLDVADLERIYGQKSQNGPASSKESRKKEYLHKKSNGKLPDYFSGEKTFSIALAGKYTTAEAFENLFGYLGQTIGHNPTSEENAILREEYNIVFVLPQSRQAYDAFRQSRIVFDIDHFNVYADLVGNIFLEDKNLLAFSAQEYDTLLSKLADAPREEESREDEDPFDLDGLEDDEIELGPEKKAFLRQMLSIQKSLTQSWYDPRKFLGSLNLLKKLLALKRYRESISMKKSSNEEWTKEELREQRKLEEEAKKASQSL